MGRHWLFEGSGGQQVNVPRFAEGLVGQKPRLGPGQWFAYGSGCTLPGGAPGTMRGMLLVAAAASKEVDGLSGVPATWEVEVAPLALKTN
jgi:uncharacterized protein affecting Mg2+/Co2+ transport